FPTFTKEDLVNLGFAQIYLTLMVDGVGSAPFSAVTLAPITQVENSHRETIIKSSRQAYSAPRVTVEEQISAWQEDGRVANQGKSANGKRSGNSGGGSKAWPAQNANSRPKDVPRPIATEKPVAVSIPSQTIPKSDPKVLEQERNKMVTEKTKTKPISLNQLKNYPQDRPIVKSDKHREELRDALKSAMSLAEQEIKNETPVVVKEKASSLSQSEKIKPEPSSNQPKSDSIVNEVPEGVLRKILAGDND
ncbi:MAG: hypothetical protein COX02_01715, partial [Candidatus Vogelbacteria bacterium CG22_combo_CG10-13_8_21_14_all_37_9]